MTYKYNKRSTSNLNRAHNKIVLLFMAVIEEVDCSIICSTRTRQEQEDAFCNGTSKLHFPHSKHNTFPSKAVDVIPYPFNGWDDYEQFERLAVFIKKKAEELGIKVKWGKEFKNIDDYPHWEL